MNPIVTGDKRQVTGNKMPGAQKAESCNASRVTRHIRAFTLVEVMVVMVLLSLIVLALMAVFNSAQTAFRAGVTQTDVLESGRATMDLITADLRIMTPSGGRFDATNGPVNFCVFTNGSAPLVQPLIASSQQRTNVLEKFFVLSRNNVNGRDIWTGTGYVVDTGLTNSIFPLYRFSASINAGAADPSVLFTNFVNAPVAGMSHLMDGVVNLTVHAYDLNGTLMTANVLYSGGQYVTNRNVLYFAPASGVTGFEMFSNTLPASVQIELGVLEDRTLQRAESLSFSPEAQLNYLAQQAGAVHVFRQCVSISNVDPSAYQ